MRRSTKDRVLNGGRLFKKSKKKKGKKEKKEKKKFNIWGEKHLYSEK